MALFKRVRDGLGELESSVEVWSVLYLGVLIYAFTVTLLTAWFLSAPYLVESGNRLLFGLGILAYNHGYILNNCHQLPERSLFLNGIQIPVCSRCIGVYVGCMLGVLTPFAHKFRNRFLNSIFFAGLLMAPLVVDGVSQTVFNMRESTNGLRFVTGVLFGLGMMYYACITVLRYSSKVIADYRRVKGTSKIVSIIFTAALLTLSVFAGMTYVTEDDALKALESAYPNAKVTSVTYIPPNALNTVPYDPFLNSYDDTVLRDITRLRTISREGYWLFTEGRAVSRGKTAYYSSTDVVRYYVNVRDGSIRVYVG